MMNKLVAALAATLFLSACGNYIERKVGAEGETLKLTAGEVEYADVKEQIFEARCVSCHRQYSSYAGVRRELGAISASVRAERMPKSGGPLSAGQKRLLELWIAAGAPERAGQNPPPEDAEIRPEWTSIYDHIIASKCLVCHNPNGEAKFLDFSTRLAVFMSRDRLFNFSDPDQSYLLSVIRDDAEPMPPPRSSIRRLNEDEIAVLREWIALGIP